MSGDRVRFEVRFDGAGVTWEMSGYADELGCWVHLDRGASIHRPHGENEASTYLAWGARGGPSKGWRVEGRRLRWSTAACWPRQGGGWWLEVECYPVRSRGAEYNARQRAYQVARAARRGT